MERKEKGVWVREKMNVCVRERESKPYRFAASIAEMSTEVLNHLFAHTYHAI
jgi:hypothetical protein